MKEDKGIIQWFSENHVAGNLLMVLVILYGWMTWPTIKKEIFPETSLHMVTIAVPFPNATPEEVEKGVVIPIEEAIQDVTGIESIRSASGPSVGTITVEIQSSHKVRDVMDDLKGRVDAIRNLAEQAEKPIFEELLMKAQVLSIALSAETDEKSLRNLTEDLRTRLLGYRGGPAIVTQAVITGIRDFEISIEVSESTLRQYGLTMDHVTRAVRQSSLDLPGGSLRTQSGEMLIRTESRRYTARQFADITVITRPDGSVVKLSDIALIRDGFEEEKVDTRFNGENAILINVFRVGDEDTIKIAETVKKFIKEEAPQFLPHEVSVGIWKDDSVHLRERMSLMARNGFTGLILVTIVLALFLRPSLAFLVALGLPVSFAGAIALMPVFGISINMISLFAFILVLGIVVDDSIIVGENVYKRIQRGEHPKLAAPRGTHEVGMVVIFGVVTTMVAFTPMLGLSGVMGKIWPNIPLIVIPALFFSILQSKLVLPSHLALLRPHDPDRPTGRFMRFQKACVRSLEIFVERFYQPFLVRALRHRYLVLMTLVMVLIISIVGVMSGWIRYTFFPEVEADVVIAKLKMPQGVAYEQTESIMRHIEEKALELNDHFAGVGGEPAVRHLLTSIGTQPLIEGMPGPNGPPLGSHLGEVTMELLPAKQRRFLSTELAAKWRELTGTVPGAVELSFTAMSAAGGNAFDIELISSDRQQLEAATRELKEAMARFPGVIDISDSNEEGKRELKLGILPAAEALGLRLEDVTHQVRQGFYGDEVQRLQRDKNEVTVYVRYPRDARTSLADLQHMRIRTPDGDSVPFSQVATVTYGRSHATIQRANQQRSIRVNADLDPTSDTTANQVVAALTRQTDGDSYFQLWAGNIARKWQEWGFGKEPEESGTDRTSEEGDLIRIVRQYPGVSYSFEGEQKDQAQTMQEMGQKFLIAVFGIYILLAIPLRSYLQPLLILSVIPFGLVGAIGGHVLLGMAFSIMSFCGVIALSGVVINDSLVLVDYVNRRRAEGMSLHEAAAAAGAARFRPIILTSVTTFAGLTPMLLETDIQAKFLIPMAVSLSFGVMFATVITLLLVPCLYLIQEDIHTLSRRWRRKQSNSPG